MKHKPVPKLVREFIIRLDVFEPELAIESLSFALRRPGIEQHLAIADGPRLADHRSPEKLADTSSVELGIDEHPLHLACAVAEIAKGNTASDLAVLLRDQQPSPGLGKLPREIVESPEKATGSK